MKLCRSTVYALLAIASGFPHVHGGEAPRSSSNGSNANHIFNAIHSSMRQFGSSLNHNGMSLFLATVPEGTEFYHGSPCPYRINDTQWLAFEPEHALIFARPFNKPPGGGKHGHGPPPPPPGGKEPGSRWWKGKGRKSWPRRPSPLRPPPSHNDKQPPQGPRHGLQQPMKGSPPERPKLPGEDDDLPFGYLHTYRTTRQLRLLYVDGQSAAKSDKGTLDTQDWIIRDPFRPSPPRPSASSPSQPSPSSPPSGPPGEAERAAEMCALANTVYSSRIDGILRMEGGFEVILCDFAFLLSVVSISAVSSPSHFGSPDGSSFDYYHAVAARYDGIGGQRVQLDYDGMLSLFSYPGAIYWDNTGRPRVNRTSSDIAGIRSILRHAIKTGQPEASVDWQGVADMIVSRYADRIEYIISGNVETLEDLKTELNSALRPFVDVEHRDQEKEVERCAAQFWPAGVKTKDLNTAAGAVRESYLTLCAELAMASRAETFEQGMGIVKSLREWLGWTTWKRCRGCGVHEVCLLPIWPIGSEKDFEQPQCVSGMEFGEEHMGYWERMGTGPPGHGDGDDGKHKPTWW